MRILLDENLDWRLSRSLPGHTVESVQKNGWAGIQNGELLTRAELEFDVFITMDGSLQPNRITPASIWR
jgi:predicted nuclease of predicted toxin-antitoxin system